MFKTLTRLGAYMGGRKWLLPCSVGLSAVNGLLSLVPFVLLWLVVRTLLTAEGNLADAPVWDYALAAFIVSWQTCCSTLPHSCSHISPHSV